MEKTYEHVNELKHDLAHNTGTTKYLYDRRFISTKYTDGFKDLMEKASCSWLLDIMATEFFDAWKKHALNDNFDFTVEIDTKKDASCTITMMGYDGNIVHERKITFTTFPEGKFEFLIAWGYTESRKEHRDMLLYLMSER